MVLPKLEIDKFGNAIVQCPSEGGQHTHDNDPSKPQPIKNYAFGHLSRHIARVDIGPGDIGIE
jgi:hypothetical protein